MDFKYPYTDFHELNLDWFLAEFKKLTAEWLQVQHDWEDEQQAFQDLHDYVQNYFANLNLYQEVHDILYSPEMQQSIQLMLSNITNSLLPTVVANQIASVVASQLAPVVAAQLPNLLNSMVPSFLPAAVAGEAAAWLADHVDPDTGYVIDDTLSIQLAAADAKAVGDRFVATDDIIYQNNQHFIGKPNLALFLNWTADKYIDDTGAIQTLSHMHYSELIPVTADEEYTIRVQKGSSTNSVRVHGYDSNDAWVSMLLMKSIGSAGDAYDVGSYTFKIPAGISSVRISMADEYIGTVPKILFAFFEGIADIETRLSNKIDRVETSTIDFSTYENGYMDSNGTVTISGNWKHLTIPNVKKDTVFVARVYASASIYAIHLRDANNAFVSGTLGAAALQNYTYTATQDGTIVINFSSSYAYSGTRAYEYDIKEITDNIDTLFDDVDVLSQLPYIMMMHKFGVIGDSLSSGEIYSGGNYRDCYRYSWLSNIANSINASAVHYSRAGMSSKEWWNNGGGFKTALANESVKPSVYYIALGTNDKNLAYPLGDITDPAGTDSFVGYMRSIIEYVHTEQPDAAIILVTTYNTSIASTPYNAMIENIAGLYSYCYFLDYAASDGPKTTESNIYVENSHYSTLGYVKVATIIKKLTEDIIKNNMADFKHFGYDNYNV